MSNNSTSASNVPSSASSSALVRRGVPIPVSDIELGSFSTSSYDNEENPLDNLETKKPINRIESTFLIFIYVILWYSIAIVAITTSKLTMNTIPFPFLLCCSQFLFATILTRQYVNRIGKYKPIQLSFRWLIVQIAISYTFGFIFTNLSFNLVNANFAETIKAGEPISTVIMGYLYLREQSSTATYLTLIPICTGVAISCMHEDSFHFFGFLFALLSNFCFSSRACVAKKLNILYSGSIDEISLFYHVSYIGLFILIPLMLIFEGKDILQLLFTNNRSKDFSLWYICSLLMINGLAYTIYNILSFLVLGRTNLITHAVLNAFRRVFIISFTAYYFHVHVSHFNIFGVFLAVAGVLCFAYTRSREKT